MLAVFFMSLMACQVVSKSSSKLYTGTALYKDVVRNQLGEKLSFIFELSLLIQYVGLPLVYLMILTYQVNFIVFHDIESIKYTLYSSGILAVLVVLLLAMTSNKLAARIGWVNFVTFICFLSFMVFLFFHKIEPGVSNITLSDKNL
jgi:amino acid permease